MKITLALLSVLSFCMPTALAQDRVAADTARLVASLNRFAADLHAELGRAATPTCSPASISFALLMLLPGARGDTAEQIATTLHLPADLRGERLLAAASALLHETRIKDGTCGFGDGNEPALRIANDFWGQRGREFGADYLRALAEKFGSTAHPVDFARDCEGTRQRINQHVANVTNQRIEDLIPRGLLSPETRCVISNAIWYRGAWVHDFYRPEDKTEPFHVTPERTVDASMMHLKETLWYAGNDTWQIAAMPMKDKAMEFVVAVPRSHDGLAAAESALLAGDWIEDRGTSLVQLSMPAFRVRGRHQLSRVLQALGMRDAFDTTRADLTGILADEPLNVDEAVHATWIGVDEHGVEAAAATALVLKATAAVREDPVAMVADRPFAFAIRDRRTGLLMFVGRVTDPTANS